MQNHRIRSNLKEISRYTDNLDLIIYCCLHVLKHEKYTWQNVLETMVQTGLVDADYLESFSSPYNNNIMFEIGMKRIIEEKIVDFEDRVKTVNIFFTIYMYIHILTVIFFIRILFFQSPYFKIYRTLLRQI
jgi:hypothetical protein